MMTDDITLRPARPGDADRGAALLYSAYLHRQVTYPLHEDGDNRFLERLQRLFRQEGNRCSYQFIQVAQQHGEVVGLVLSFGGREEERLNAAVGWQLEREAQEDEWYVDALAVFTNWGRRGIATRLLQAVEQQARHYDYRKIALNVAQENEQALSLYQRLQYVITQQTLLYHHPHVRLVKRLDNNG
jgi:ribosomal protein S18 acetylase RimI-like enzyme